MLLFWQINDENDIPSIQKSVIWIQAAWIPSTVLYCTCILYFYIIYYIIIFYIYSIVYLYYLWPKLLFDTTPLNLIGRPEQ